MGAIAQLQPDDASDDRSLADFVAADLMFHIRLGPERAFLRGNIQIRVSPNPANQ
jgi:hypothetical protein